MQNKKPYTVTLNEASINEIKIILEKQGIKFSTLLNKLLENWLSEEKLKNG